MSATIVDGRKVLAPPKKAGDFLRLLDIKDEIGKEVDLELVVLMNKDSANMTPSDWTTMAEAVHSRRDEGFDGFVIAHGTDTMHFSASALAFAFGRSLKAPIVFTGAQTIPAVSHGDARINLLRAVKVARSDLSEVVIAFGNHVFRGCRAQKKDERRFDAFDSPAEAPLGEITMDILLGRRERRGASSRQDPFLPHYSDGIVQFAVTPGMEPEILLPLVENPACRGVVLQSFGAGNLPNEGAYSFEPFIRRATQAGKPVVIVSPFAANSTLASEYAPGVAARQAGAIATGDMTNAAATVKFRWLMHQAEAQQLDHAEKVAFIRSNMNKNYVGEVTEDKKCVG